MPGSEACAGRTVGVRKGAGPSVSPVAARARPVSVSEMGKRRARRRGSMGPPEGASVVALRTPVDERMFPGNRFDIMRRSPVKVVEMVLRRREEEAQVRGEGRLPSGQALTQKFPVLHYGPVPRFDPATWDFRVWGEVEQQRRWTWDEFQKLPRTKIRMDIHCVTRWSKFDTDWAGVSLRTLVDGGLVRLKPNARHVLQHCEYGFTVNIPLQVGLSENFLLATHFDGQPLTPDHGYPPRGVVGS